MTQHYTTVDFNYGTEQEQLLWRTLVNKFGECKKIKGKYAIYDFEGENFFVELKSRRSNYNQYPTTMVGQNKIDKAEVTVKTGADVYFCFNFLDGLYYWKYNKQETLDKVMFLKGGRFDRGRPELKDYCYIPIELLTKI